MATNSEAAEPPFETAVPLTNGSSLQLPVSTAAPLFVVGPNGAGKSGLMLSLYRKNFARAVRVAAHRQTWMETNSVPFSPQSKIQTETNTKNQDAQPEARWREYDPASRSGLIIADLIDADNNLSRNIRAAVKSGKSAEAAQLADELPPLETINELLVGSGIPIAMTIEPNSTIVARKREGPPYSIAALSDGERAALLIAGVVLTAKKGSLILVDEPERHLHASIVTPLLLQLFAKRPDCTFVVSTHELSLPVSCRTARTVLVRDSKTVNDDVGNWDLDVLEPGIGIDDPTKEAIIGSRRKMLFIEGSADSLDKPLYEILFPGVSIFPRATCSDVEHAVTSVRDTSAIAWIQAYGIVDQDQLTSDKKIALEAKGVFALAVYSVEALYYNPTIVELIAKRQCTVIEGDPSQMIVKAWTDLLAAIASNADRLAARMTEQAVKDQISLEMPDWKKIQAGQNVSIAVDSQAHYQAEKARLQGWIISKDVDKIIARYPIRETAALTVIVSALQFKSRSQYEAAVRKLVIDDVVIRSMLAEHFGGLPAAMT
ncbi:AAA family ATPase [Mesorhizobium sp. M1328]|uniref:AAA family ATPase n=1 Tax=Mesorhizobium sp. M1328 TaxID=2957082 RepID=UPI0033378A19